MEIIEVNKLGVRSAIVHLTHSGDETLRFTLYPIVHIARKQYYQEISERLWRHDLIVAAGSEHPSFQTHLLKLAHRLAGGSEGTGLVTLPSSLIPVNVPTIRVDVPRRRLSLIARGLAISLAAALAAYLRAVGSARLLARALAVREDRLRQPNWKPQHSLGTVIKNERDALLIQQLCRLHLIHRNRQVHIAVVIDAEDTAAVATYLISGLQYELQETETCTVIDR